MLLCDLCYYGYFKKLTVIKIENLDRLLNFGFAMSLGWSNQLTALAMRRENVKCGLHVHVCVWYQRWDKITIK